MAAIIRHGLDGTGRVGTVRCAGSAPATPMHAHRSLVIGRIDAGSRILTLPGETWRLEAGDGFVMPPDVPHALTAAGDGGHRIVAVDPAAFAIPGWMPGIVGDRAWSDAFDALHGAAEAGDADIGPLVSTLLELTGPLMAPRDAPLGGCRPVRLARRVAARDLGRPLDLSALARQVGLSPFHLHRLYRRFYGLTPAEHRLEARLRLARRLILGGAAIADAAAALGFADQSHFSRAFRRLMGVPPGLWARQVRRSAAVSRRRPSTP